MTRPSFFYTRPCYAAFGAFFAFEAVIDRPTGWRVFDLLMVAVNIYWFARADREL